MKMDETLLQGLQDAVVAAQRDLLGYVVACCPGGEAHATVQHRDGRSPWCAHCRRTDVGVLIP